MKPLLTSTRPFFCIHSLCSLIAFLGRDAELYDELYDDASVTFPMHFVFVFIASFVNFYHDRVCINGR